MDQAAAVIETLGIRTRNKKPETVNFFGGGWGVQGFRVFGALRVDEGFSVVEGFWGVLVGFNSLNSITLIMGSPTTPPPPPRVYHRT